MKNDFQHLIGKDKKEVLAELGQEFNFYPSEIWTYILHTSCFGRKTVLLLFFENEVLKKINIKKYYGKIKTGLSSYL